MYRIGFGNRKISRQLQRSDILIAGVRMGTGKSRSRSATPGQMSRMSRMVVKLKTVVLNDTPKCRSRAVARLVMPAALAKQSMLNDYPKCRSRAVARFVMLAAWAKQSMLSDYPKRRSREARECGSEKLKARKVVNRCAQRYSKISEWGKPAKADVV